MAVTIRITTRTSPPTATPLGTTHIRARTDGVQASTARTAALASALATIRAPGPTREARPRTGLTAHAALRKPTTRARERTDRRPKAPTRTGAGARPRRRAATTGQRRIDTRTIRRGRPRARSEETHEQLARAAARTADGPPWARGATSTREKTAMPTGARTARGRNTTTAAGRILTGSPRERIGRSEPVPVSRGPIARPIAAPSIS